MYTFYATPESLRFPSEGGNQSIIITSYKTTYINGVSQGDTINVPWTAEITSGVAFGTSDTSGNNQDKIVIGASKNESNQGLKGTMIISNGGYSNDIEYQLFQQGVVGVVEFSNPILSSNLDSGFGLGINFDGLKGENICIVTVYGEDVILVYGIRSNTTDKAYFYVDVDKIGSIELSELYNCSVNKTYIGPSKYTLYFESPLYGVVHLIAYLLFLVLLSLK